MATIGITKQQQTNKNKDPKRRKKKCKHCKIWFEPERDNQLVCENIECAISYGKVLKEKQQRQTKKAFNQTDKSKLRDSAIFYFNKFIRLRDKYLPCVSCGHTHGRQFHAGHFKPAGANPQLRFNELNVHKQCSICNNYKSGNLADYRIELINRIGLKNVEALDIDRSIKKYSVDDYKNIIVKYKLKIKELENV